MNVSSAMNYSINKIIAINIVLQENENTIANVFCAGTNCDHIEITLTK